MRMVPKVREMVTKASTEWTGSSFLRRTVHRTSISAAGCKPRLKSGCIPRGGNSKFVAGFCGTTSPTKSRNCRGLVLNLTRTIYPTVCMYCSLKDKLMIEEYSIVPLGLGHSRLGGGGEG